MPTDMRYIKKNLKPLKDVKIVAIALDAGSAAVVRRLVARDY